MKRIQQVSLSLFLLLCLLLSACGAAPGGTQTSFSLEDVPAFSGEPYVVLSDNQPGFTQEELDQAAQGFEKYSPLDALGRCGTAYASVGLDTMPTQDRESISSVKPSGWQTAKYDTDLVDGGYLYNRCHLIGFQLTGENANEENLITGTSVAALTIFTAVFAYGDLMWPLVVNSDLKMMTLSSGLATLRGQFSTNFPVLMAGSLLAMLPMVVLYMIFQRQFIEGIANTGGK